ncbi:MAG: helix-turn-helix domain-containing protein [Alphaproteobacteria bacterium]
MAPSETIPGAGTSDESESPELAWIRDRLARPGKTQRGLATALGLDPSAVSRLLTGQRQLRAAELPVVSAYLEIDTPPSRHTSAASGFRFRADAPRDTAALGRRAGLTSDGHSRRRVQRHVPDERTGSRLY